MAMKRETLFRKSVVIPFLKKLKNTSYFPIQQMAIIGDADFILCCSGRFVWLELKAKGGKPGPLQIYKADWVKKTHGVAIVADPDNWREVSCLLAKLDNGER